MSRPFSDRECFCGRRINILYSPGRVDSRKNVFTILRNNRKSCANCRTGLRDVKKKNPYHFSGSMYCSVFFLYLMVLWFNFKTEKRAEKWGFANGYRTVEPD